MNEIIVLYIESQSEDPSRVDENFLVGEL